MAGKLALDSPQWEQLSACYSAANAITRLREIVATRQLGEAWSGLRDEIMHQGTVYGVSAAAIPHLVDIAPALTVVAKRELWTEIGFLVTAGVGKVRIARALRDALAASLRTAEIRAVRDYLADAEVTPDQSLYYVLACAALAGHQAAEAMWRFPSVTAGYVDLRCPGCGTHFDVDGFADPVSPPGPVPAFRSTSGRSTVWREAAGAIEQAARDRVLGPDWDGLFETAHQVAVAGVPTHAPSGAVWCLIAAMMATKPLDAVPAARKLARLAGHVRCPRCDKVWVLTDAMIDGADATPVQVGGDLDFSPDYVQPTLFQLAEGSGPAARLPGVPLATVADAVAGFPPAPGRKVARGQATARTLWRADGDAVDALTLMPGRPDIVAAGSNGASQVRDMATGALAGASLAGPASVLASLTLPDGRPVVAASGDDGRLRWWNGASSQLLGEATAASPAPIRSLAAVRMPLSPQPRTEAWLAELCDGRTVLAAGDADGAVRLWDPQTHTCLRELCRRPGRAVTTIVSVEDGRQPPSAGTCLVVAYRHLAVDVWFSGSVHGDPWELVSDRRKLAAVAHQHLTSIAPSRRRSGRDSPILLADRNGSVSSWDTLGLRLGDPLPPDPRHREVIGMAVRPAAGDGIAVMTASREDRNLRIWEPLRGTVAFVPLGVRPRCLVDTGDALVIGHDTGLLALAL